MSCSEKHFKYPVWNWKFLKKCYAVKCPERQSNLSYALCRYLICRNNFGSFNGTVLFCPSWRYFTKWNLSINYICHFFPFCWQCKLYYFQNAQFLWPIVSWGFSFLETFLFSFCNSFVSLPSYLWIFVSNCTISCFC